jgi:CRP-like cAMP-binding protein
MHRPPPPATATSNPSTVVAIDERTFVYLVHETPMFALQVMRSIAARLREVDRYA